MDFEELCGYFDRVDSISGRIEMTSVVTELFLKSKKDLGYTVLAVQGKLFPAWDRSEIGIASKLMLKCLSTATGLAEKKFSAEIAKTGDTGLAAQELFKGRVQTTLGSGTLTLKVLFDTAKKVSAMQGQGSQQKKVKYLVELLNMTKPAQAKYLVRLLLGEMRLGIGQGIVRDSIANAFECDPSLVERAYSFTSDYTEVAAIARDKGEAGLKKIRVSLFRPLRPMLAQSIHSVEEALSSFSPCFWEQKYDGLRVQIHKKADKIVVFTRRLDNVTHQFPDLVEIARKFKCKNCIVEGEAVAFKSGKPLPFQILSRRIKRKYDVGEMVKKIPIKLFLFDCLLFDGEVCVEAELKNRRKLLKKISPNLSELIITGNAAEAEKFYRNSLEQGHEGVMIKNPDSAYKAGSRVGTWYKLKPVSESLDVVVVGGEWGEGRRAKYLGSFLVACRDPDSGEFLEIGKVATGFKDDDLKHLTEVLKDKVVEERGRTLVFRPDIVLEVNYQEIQKSPKYRSGFALRFPRLVRLREDRAPDECDTIERVAKLYEMMR